MNPDDKVLVRFPATFAVKSIAEFFARHGHTMIWTSEAGCFDVVPQLSSNVYRCPGMGVLVGFQL